MSEGIVVALIGFAGVVIAALIAAARCVLSTRFRR